MTTRVIGMKFPLGRVVATPGAIATMGELNISPISLLERHVSGDWGDLCKEDREQNEEALKIGNRLMSVYGVDGTDSTQKVWVITEWDRSVTTILLPDEY